MKKIIANQDYWWGTLLLILLLIGQWQKISLAQISFYLHDVVVISWLAELWFRHDKLLSAKLASQLRQISPVTRWWWAGLIGVICLGWLLNLEWLGGSLSAPDLSWPLLYLARLSAYLLLAWTLIVTRPFSFSQQKIALGTFFLSGLVIGLAWLKISPDMRWLAILGFDDHYYRLVGTQLDPNFAGLILVGGWWWILANLTKKDRFFWLALLALFLMAIALTWSRATYLSLVISSFTALLYYQSFRNFWRVNWGSRFLPLCLAAVMLLLVAVIPKPAGEGGQLLRESSIKARLTSTESRLASLSGRDWLIGQGLFVINQAVNEDSFTRPNHARLPDNIFVTLLSGIGLIGLSIISALVWRSRGWLKKISLTYPLTATYMAAILVHTQFNNSLLHPFVGLTWLMLLVAENHLTSKQTQP